MHARVTKKNVYGLKGHEIILERYFRLINVVVGSRYKVADVVDVGGNPVIHVNLSYAARMDYESSDHLHKFTLRQFNDHFRVVGDGQAS